jgi:hypothetical protein
MPGNRQQKRAEVMSCACGFEQLIFFVGKRRQPEFILQMESHCLQTLPVPAWRSQVEVLVERLVALPQAYGAFP